MVDREENRYLIVAPGRSSGAPMRGEAALQPHDQVQLRNIGAAAQVPETNLDLRGHPADDLQQRLLALQRELATIQAPLTELEGSVANLRDSSQFDNHQDIQLKQNIRELQAAAAEKEVQIACFHELHQLETQMLETNRHQSLELPGVLKRSESGITSLEARAEEAIPEGQYPRSDSGLAAAQQQHSLACPSRASAIPRSPACADALEAPASRSPAEQAALRLDLHKLPPPGTVSQQAYETYREPSYREPCEEPIESDCTEIPSFAPPRSPTAEARPPLEPRRTTLETYPPSPPVTATGTPVRPAASVQQEPQAAVRNEELCGVMYSQVADLRATVARNNQEINKLQSALAARDHQVAELEATRAELAQRNCGLQAVADADEVAKRSLMRRAMEAHEEVAVMQEIAARTAIAEAGLTKMVASDFVALQQAAIEAERQREAEARRAAELAQERNETRMKLEQAAKEQIALKEQLSSFRTKIAAVEARSPTNAKNIIRPGFYQDDDSSVTEESVRTEKEPQSEPAALFSPSAMANLWPGQAVCLEDQKASLLKLAQDSVRDSLMRRAQTASPYQTPVASPAVKEVLPSVPEAVVLPAAPAEVVTVPGTPSEVISLPATPIGPVVKPGEAFGTPVQPVVKPSEAFAGLRRSIPKPKIVHPSATIIETCPPAKGNSIDASPAAAPAHTWPTIDFLPTAAAPVRGGSHTSLSSALSPRGGSVTYLSGVLSPRGGSLTCSTPQAVPMSGGSMSCPSATQAVVAGFGSLSCPSPVAATGFGSVSCAPPDAGGLRLRVVGVTGPVCGSPVAAGVAALTKCPTERTISRPCAQDTAANARRLSPLPLDPAAEVNRVPQMTIKSMPATPHAVSVSPTISAASPKVAQRQHGSLHVPSGTGGAGGRTGSLQVPPGGARLRFLL